MNNRFDVVIVGSGAIGLTTAYYLARSGVRHILVLERAEPSRESSWAGAGIVSPAVRARATTPFQQLLGLSRELYPALTDDLRRLSQLDNGFRRCGGVELRSGVSDSMVQAWNAEGIETEPLSSAELCRLEPVLSPDIEPGYYQPDMAQVRNPHHLRALLTACRSLGIEIRPHDAVREFRRHGERVHAVVTESEVIEADRFLIAAGAWSDQLLEQFGVRLGIFPMRGQIVLFNPGRVLLRMIVMKGKDYLVPREDGRILAGSTEENAGFVKRTTEEGLAHLTALAYSLVPALRDVPIETSWAGLRPATRDELPFLGLVPGLANLFVAAGHFRSGLMLSPATGWVMSQLLSGQTPEIRLEPFALDRQ